MAYIQSADGKVGKREIARAFAIKGEGRKHLKVLLREMADEGLLVANRRSFREKGTLPSVTVLEITGHDPDGELLGAPLSWNDDEGPRPNRLDPSPRTGRSASSQTEATRPLGVGDRVLCRITPASPDDGIPATYTAQPIKRLPREQRRLLGIFRRHRGGATIQPIDKKALREWPVRKTEGPSPEDGELVRFELYRSGRFATPEARILERLGNPSDQRKISLIAIHNHAIPDEFPESVSDAASALKPFDPDQKLDRDDLRHLPLITIDPTDARDHDDAVHAAPDQDPGQPRRPHHHRRHRRRCPLRCTGISPRS